MFVLSEQPAHACGGCFVPAETQTAVDSHRMVIALGMEETVLWDQIVYSGSPEDFVWVLPVPSPDVVIETADSEFFDALDRGTAPQIQPVSSPPFCSFAADSAGCGASASDAGGPAPADTPFDGVIVYDHGVVGPYETLTIGAEDPNALYDWLELNGYAITEDAVPAMEYYIGLEHAFVVLRLQPDEQVSAMEPVRVRYPGFMGTFPLKMVVVGAQGVLDLSLWVFAEQRYDAVNYGTLEIDESRLEWDWNTNTSNYAARFDATVEEGGSRAWVAEFAGTMEQIWLPDTEDTALIRSTVQISPYLTRLRTRVLVDHLDEDMVLGPSEIRNDVSPFLFAPIDVNYPEVNCGTSNSNTDDDSVYCTLGAGNGKDAAFLGLVMVLGVMLVFRVRRETD